MENTPNQIRILIVEDDPKIAHLVNRQLTKAQYFIEQVSDGESAIEFLSNHETDLIVLDLNLPKMSGYEVLKELRTKGKNIPVLILSANAELDDRVHGLDLGADDYLVKPFSSDELLARIHAVLRRAGITPAATLQVHDLVFDLAKRIATRGGKRLKLTQRELELLEFFLRNKNQILTRKQIAEEVWGHTFDTGTNNINVFVSHLRRAIDHGFETKLIHTIYGQGFILKDS